MPIIIDPSPTLRMFLEARSSGASEHELKALQAADEASREAAVWRIRSNGDIIFLPARKATKAGTKG